MNARSHRRDDPSRNSSNAGTTRRVPKVCAMFKKILIANRGAIACRILRTVQAHGHRAPSPCIPRPTRTRRTCGWPTRRTASGPRRPPRVICAASASSKSRAQSGARGHPSRLRLPVRERRLRRRPAKRAGIAFIGPTPAQMRDFGLKHTARALAQRRGLPLLPGTDCWPTCRPRSRRPSASAIPVMLKSTAGGGGIGMRRCDYAAELARVLRGRAAARGRTTSATPACSSRSSWRARGTSKCRSSATAAAR